MQLTDLMAHLIGGYGLLSAILMMTQPNLLEAIFDGYEDSAALSYTMGIIVFFGGGLLVGHHNVWTNWSASVVTVVGWAALIKGALFIIMPSAMIAISRPIMRIKILVRIFALITAALSLSLLVPFFL